MLLVHEDMVTAAQAAELCGKSINAVWQWGHRGVKLPTGERFRLCPVGRDATGANLYHLRDVAIVHNAVTTRGTSRAHTIPRAA